jgi:hypothetical protein
MVDVSMNEMIFHSRIFFGTKRRYQTSIRPSCRLVRRRNGRGKISSQLRCDEGAVKATGQIGCEIRPVGSATTADAGKNYHHRARVACSGDMTEKIILPSYFRSQNYLPRQIPTTTIPTNEL